MTAYRLNSDWMNNAKERVQGAGDRKVRRMSRREEKLLLKILMNSEYQGINNSLECYLYRG